MAGLPCRPHAASPGEWQAGRTAAAAVLNPPPHERHRPLRPLAHRLPPYRRRAHRLFNWLFAEPSRRHVPPAHRGYRPRALDARGGGGDHRRAPAGSASTGTARSCCSRSARRAMPRRRGRWSQRAGPITAIARRPSSRRCASERAPRDAPCAMTAPGATAIPSDAPPGVAAGHSPQGAARRARR